MEQRRWFFVGKCKKLLSMKSRFTKKKKNAFSSLFFRKLKLGSYFYWDHRKKSLDETHKISFGKQIYDFLYG